MHTTPPQGSPKTADFPNPHFTDELGRIWTVAEQSCLDAEGKRGRCLIFTTEGVVRRVRQFPPDWYRLDAAGLVRLSWER